MTRRRFLAGAAAGALLLPLGRHAWAALGPTAAPRRLIVVFLRGAVDGLNVVVPYGDRDYRPARPTLALPPPGAADGVLDLDGHFGLNPALAGLMPLWRERRLAFIHASGSPDPQRSHFEAQAAMESATPGHPGTPDGWLNRWLQQQPGPQAPTQAISLGPTTPHILAGRAPVANLPLGNAATQPVPTDRPEIAGAFDRLYAGNATLAAAFRQGQSARAEMLSDLSQEMAQADNGAPLPNGFAPDAARLGRLMRQDARIKVGFAALGGWDTHVNQGAAKGQLFDRLKALGTGLTALVDALGPLTADTLILVMSEFGRTVRENGNGGTDHGHGNVMWALGGTVAGGKVYGDWPGLAPDRLYERRDLAVTTDYRAVLAVALERHLRVGDPSLQATLPGAPAPGPALQRLVTA